MIDTLTSALSSFLPDAVTAVAAPAIQGAGIGALSSLVTGKSPGVSALIGGGLGAAYGAFGNNGPLSSWIGGGSPSSLTGLTDTNGNYIVPPVPPDVAAEQATNAAGIGAAPGGGTYDTAGNVVRNAGPLAANASSTASGAGSGLGGILGSGSGVGGTGISKTSLALGALALLGSAMSKPKPAQLPGAAQNPNVGPTWNQPLNTDVPGRTAVNPWPTGSGPNYWAYGGPEATYFTGNSLKNFGFAHGGDVRGAMEMGAGADNGEFNTANGDHYVEGPGSGQDDLIDAKLSDGEFVFDAATVSRIGQGSSKAGAEKLEAVRNAIAKKAGQKKFLPKNTGGALNSLMEAA